MKMTIRSLLLSIAILTAASPALAEEPATSTTAVTEIRVDEEAGVIRFVVDGKTIATIDKSGLTVEGDVRYTGATHDVGPSAEASDQE
jgi:hypothetical protein